MQATEHKKMTENEFEVIKRAAQNISRAKRRMRGERCSSDSLPSILGFKLTNRCNLRCKHCYEWNDKGYHHNMNDKVKNMDLDYAVIERCLSETKAAHPFIYLWGGEPLIYHEIGRLLAALAEEKLTTATCTNGIAILDKLELLLALSEHLELLIALDGDEESNNALRGAGTFQKVMAAIDTLMACKKEGTFQGKVSVHTMVSNDNIHRLQEYVAMLDDKGIDSLLLCLPWYISPATSSAMDVFYHQYFDWLSPSEEEQVKSWHSFKYQLDTSRLDYFKEKIYEVVGHPWRMHVKLQPDLDKSLFEDFVNGKAIYEHSRNTCLSIASRMDILPSGKVTSCKHFPEFSLGDLSKQSVAEIWNSKEMNRVREILDHNTMPVCTKCNNFYLHGYKAKESGHSGTKV